MENSIKQLKDGSVVLTIDGNYFAHRCVHSLRMDSKDLTLDTNQDMLRFEQNLHEQFMALYYSFNNDNHRLIDNIVFTFDNDSWRKMETPHRPYYIPETSSELIGYKANRKALKEKDNLNYENFTFCIENFIAKIKDLVCVFNPKGAEADDSLTLLSRYLRSKNITTIIFCTDGDLKQLVNDKVILYRNTKSKELPNGEIVISPAIGKAYFAQLTPQEMVLGKTGMSQTQKEFYQKLFNLQINGGQQKSNAQRTLGNGVTVGEYFSDSFVKCICGDKKDNIFPLFRWVSGGASARNMSVTPKMMEKVVKLNGYSLTDSLIVRLLAAQTDEDKDLLTTFLYGLIAETKQQGLTKNVMNHFKHNFKINMLTLKNIPDFVKDNFNIMLEKNNDLLHNVISDETFIKLSRNNTFNDSANILSVSIPAAEQNNNPDNNQNSDNQKLIDDILNQ